MTRINQKSKSSQKSFERVDWRYYDRIESGEYAAYCAVAFIYFDPFYQRYTCLLVWDVLSPDGENIATIRQWFNLGSGKEPKASRRSKYWHEWVTANGGQPPSRADRLSPTIFKRRIARIVVADTTSSPPYSIVQKILSWQ